MGDFADDARNEEDRQIAEDQLLDAVKPRRVTLRCPECGYIESVPNWFDHQERSEMNCVCDKCEDLSNDQQ